MFNKTPREDNTTTKIDLNELIEKLKNKKVCFDFVRKLSAEKKLSLEDYGNLVAHYGEFPLENPKDNTILRSLENQAYNRNQINK